MDFGHNAGTERADKTNIEVLTTRVRTLGRAYRAVVIAVLHDVDLLGLGLAIRMQTGGTNFFVGITKAIVTARQRFHAAQLQALAASILVTNLFMEKN